LDFEHWPDIKNETIRSVSRVPQTKTAPVEEGEKLDVDFGSFQVQVAVLVCIELVEVSAKGLIKE
jgi:hypothetical protein